MIPISKPAAQAAEQTPAAAPPQAAGKSDLDALLTELNVPKQQFFTDPAAPGATEAAGSPFFAPDDQQPDPIDPEAAKRAGRRAAALCDGVLSFGAAIIGKTSDTDRYSASEGEKNDLAEAWEAVAEKYSFEVNPWISVVFLTLTIYAPKYIEALNDRRFNKMQEEINELRAEQERITAEIMAARKEAADQTTPQK